MRLLKGDIRFSLTGIFLICLFYIPPFFDAITGYLVISGIFSESFLGSPSQLIRAVIFALSLRFIMREDFYKVGAFLAFFISVELISFLSYQQVGGLLTSLVFSYKLLFPIAIYFALKGLLKRGNLELPRLKSYFIDSGFLYALGVVFPFILGVGFSTYSEGAFGTKGFYSSGNGLGMFLGVISVFALYENFHRRSLVNLVKVLVTIAGLLLVGTKASMIFLLVILLLVFFSMRFIFKVASVAILVTAVVYYQKVLLNMFATVYDVILLRFNKSESIWSFIFSGRDNYVKAAIQEFRTDGLLFYRNFIGGGSFLSFRDPAGFVPPFDTLETDFFDIFFMYGIVGLMVYCSIILSGVFVALKKKLPLYMCFFLIVMGHSLVAGHVIFNGMSVLAVILLLLTINLQRLEISYIND